MKPQATFESALAAIEFAENPLDLRYCTDADEREAVRAARGLEPTPLQQAPDICDLPEIVDLLGWCG